VCDFAFVSGCFYANSVQFFHAAFDILKKDSSVLPYYYYIIIISIIVTAFEVVFARYHLLNR
jgi:hypothetical protein